MKINSSAEIQTTVMNGKTKLFIAGFIFGAAIYIFRKNEKISPQINTSFDQYRNRLKEFFIEENIEAKMQKMFEYIDHGINKEDAFAMILMDSEIERF
jgi:hypothetical protein